MKKLLALVLAALFALSGVAAAGARDAPVLGHVDPGFGARGQVLLPPGTVEGSESALLPGGGVVVAEREKMLALQPSGEIDRDFGEGGIASLLLPPGATEAEIVAVLVDSRGRVITVGSCTFPPADAPPEGSHLGILAERFTGDGQLDRSFGDGMGFTVARFDGDRPSRKPKAIASVVAAALDDADRVLVSGEFAGGQINYKGFPYGAPEPFVTRLAPDGAVDSSFGEGGVISMPGTTHVGDPVPDSTGGVYAATSQSLFHLRADGRLDPAFGENGVRQPVRYAYELAGVDNMDRPLFDGQLATRGVSDRIVVKRLQPDGALDRSFGQNGATTLRLPRLHDVELSLDEGGGVLIAATQKRRRHRGRQPELPPTMVLTRLRPGDRLETPFGRGGLLRIPFQRGQRAQIDHVDVDGSEVLLGGKWCEPGPCGRAFVRVELGSP